MIRINPRVQNEPENLSRIDVSHKKFIELKKYQWTQQKDLVTFLLRKEFLESP